MSELTSRLRLRVVPFNAAKMAAVLALSAALLGTIYLALVPWNSPRMYLTTPLKYANDTQLLQQLARQDLAMGWFANSASARLALTELPWVASGTLRFELPGRVIVDVEESQPIALWNGVAYLDDLMRVEHQAPLSIPPYLPCLNGPAGQHEAMMQQFRNYAFWIQRYASSYRLRSMSVTHGGMIQLGLQSSTQVKPCTQLDMELLLGNGLESDTLMSRYSIQLEQVRAQVMESRLKRFLIHAKRNYLMMPAGTRYDLRYEHGFAINTDHIVF